MKLFRKTLLVAITLFLSLSFAIAQTNEKAPLKFAFLADLHVVEEGPSINDLLKCIEDINNNPDIKFVILAGDITEFGNDEEIYFAKKLIDKLNKPYYIIAGNHDSKWSESGCNTFVEAFGYEMFEFEAAGIKFIGCNSGPNMRMMPALVPRESMVWLDSISKAIEPTQPVIFVNHFPMDTSVLNYTRVLDKLKEMNTQLIMGGHWHQNRAMVYQGLPGMLGRSTQKKGKLGAGYNIVTIDGSTITFSERIAYIEEGENKGKSTTLTPWHTLRMSNGVPYNTKIDYPKPDFSVNEKYPQIKTLWEKLDNSDIGTGATLYKDYVIYTNTSGWIYALNSTDGKEIWSYKTSGKVFSTPAVANDIVTLGSTDGYIYALNVKDGSLIWRYKCDKSVLGSPTIFKGVVYIGASDRAFRAINLKTGKLVWENRDIRGFIEAKAYVDKDQVVIGDWANTLYSFDTKTGELQWEWKNRGSRMLSPAAVWPVKADGKILFVTPQRLNYAVDAKTGEELWCNKGGRESIGLSPDKSQYYIKVMSKVLTSYSTKTGDVVWERDCDFGYEISPTPTTSVDKGGKENKGLIFVPTDKGNIIALNVVDGSVAWKHRISIALINYIQPVEENRLLITTMDGVVTMLEY